jgi:lipoteichoic acid synthase
MQIEIAKGANPARDARGLAADRLFGALLGWALVSIVSRWRMLVMAEAARRLADDPAVHSPLLNLLLASYQDLTLVAVVAWLLLGLLAATAARALRRILLIAGWTLSSLGAGYAVLNCELYRHLQSPLTVRLLALSDNLQAIQAILINSIFGLEALAVVCAPLVVLAAGILAPRIAPHGLRRLRSGFCSRWAVAAGVVYFAAGQLYATHFDAYPVANAEWRFVESAFEPQQSVLTDPFSLRDLEDFSPSADELDHATRHVTGALPAGGKHLNVLVFVMESVGTKYLQLYGARYHDSDEMTRLAEHGAMFTDVYASQPLSASALAALVVSTYPDHFMTALPRYSPKFMVSGLPQMLEQNGYRTGFFGYNFGAEANLVEFLRAHGTGFISGAISKCGAGTATGCDRSEVADAIDWIRRDRTQPFFLILWTSDSHYPYTPPTTDDYRVGNADLNRYLNAVRWNDDLLSQIEAALAAEAIEDDTLIVIVGDHGEAFGEHGDFTHNSAVYDEEVKVPLLLVNRRLFPEPLRINTLGQQIDVPPTILALLGLPAPPDWQGRSLFSTTRSGRAYLFANRTDYTFGFVEHDTKLIYYPVAKRYHIFDLARDPSEKHDLADDPQYREWRLSGLARLAAWNSYQQSHLLKLMPVQVDHIPWPN